MKKKLFLLTVLPFMFINNVNAEVVDYGKTKYFIDTELKCGNERVLADYYIEKTGKLAVVDDNENHYIWKENNVCDPLKEQDKLDYNNSSYSGEFYDSGVMNSIYHYTSDVHFIEAYIPALGEYDSSKQYYYVTNRAWPVTNPNPDDFSTYYEYVTLRSPETTTVDSNTTYYKYSSINIYKKTDPGEVTSSNISNYYIYTTKEAINYKETKYTMDETLYNTLTNGVYSSDFVYFKDTMLLNVMPTSETYKYYKMSGEEITKYNGKAAMKDDNYTLVATGDYNEINIYDETESKLIFTKTYNLTGFLYQVGKSYTSVQLQEWLGEYGNTIYIRFYKPLSGDNQTFTGNKDITMKYSGKYESFRELKINGELVSTNNYTVTSGSTVITLKKEYLNTLDNGTYTVSAVYIDGGYADITLNINKVVNNPQTSDNIELYIIISFISLISIIITIKKIKKVF